MKLISSKEIYAQSIFEIFLKTTPQNNEAYQILPEGVQNKSLFIICTPCTLSHVYARSAR
jgi:hypothetical protein